jgi:hypothetical protein
VNQRGDLEISSGGGRANHVVQKTYALKGQIYLGKNKKIKGTSQLHGSNHL